MARRSLLRLSIPLREPFVTAAGTMASRELLLLRIEDEDGLAGFGEGAPLEPYDGVSIDRVARALRPAPGDPGRSDFVEGPRGSRPAGAAGGPPQAVAAEEMARLDLAGRRSGRPVAEPRATRVAVNRTLPAGPPAEAAARAADGLVAGYTSFKLKVGLPDDAERVAAVREALGPAPALRVDANGAWTVEEAVSSIRSLARHRLDLVEQPCRTLAELAAVRRAVDVPLAADESTADAEDVRAAARAGACDVVNVKLAASGGLSGARAALRAAAEHGLASFLSSTLDGPWGIAAALQLAASEEVALPSGLATLELFDASLARALPPPADGHLAVPRGPGLGVEVGGAALAEVLVEELE